MHKELVIRLSKYKRVLYKLKALGLKRVFSNNLGDGIGVAPTLVRKDFSALGFFGNKKGGYDIEVLVGQIDQILGKESPQEIIIVGCGRIGSALMRYDGFAAEGIKVVAGFDINPQSIDNIIGVTIYHIDELENFIKERGIQVGVLSVPDTAAATVLDNMVKAGIKGIINFASIELRGTSEAHEVGREGCLIENVNIGLELEQLFYRINKPGQKPEGDNQ